MSGDADHRTGFVSHAALVALVDELVAAGVTVIGPTSGGLLQSPSGIAAAAVTRPGVPPEIIAYRELKRGEELRPDAGIPELSLKAFFLPPWESLLRWRQDGMDAACRHAEAPSTPRVVIGARPCDVAALELVDRVMHWDTTDELWHGRRASTTILSLACPVEDETCFCTAVGLGPDTTAGADGLLTPVPGGYELRSVTTKGDALADRLPLTADGDADAAERYRAEARARVAANLQVDTGAIAEWLAGHFDDPLLARLGARCNGCGVCASVCPTCHCFDIVDEPDSVATGARRRHWDTCQTTKFTLHASGHNPRTDQHVRMRQRINHKFAVYPERFGVALCSGCGRCARACHAGQDLVEILSALDEAARSRA